jgi:hypothetical protein
MYSEAFCVRHRCFLQLVGIHQRFHSISSKASSLTALQVAVYADVLQLVSEEIVTIVTRVGSNLHCHLVIQLHFI